jgi:hypothetical protein
MGQNLRIGNVPFSELHFDLNINHLGPQTHVALSVLLIDRIQFLVVG